MRNISSDRNTRGPGVRTCCKAWFRDSAIGAGTIRKHGTIYTCMIHMHTCVLMECVYVSMYGWNVMESATFASPGTMYTASQADMNTYGFSYADLSLQQSKVVDAHTLMVFFSRGRNGALY